MIGPVGTRAVARWAWRMFRRDWRQQALVLVLLTVAVAASSYGVAVGHALAPGDQATFGTATGRIQYLSADSTLAARTLAAAHRSFGAVEEIADWSTPIPGSVRRLDIRTQDPHGTFAASTLRLLSGRYPTNISDVALTPSVSQFLNAPIGTQLQISGTAHRVVGLVENPTDLGAQFALVTTLTHAQPVQYTLLVNATATELSSFRSRLTVPGPVSISQPTSYSRDLGVLLVAALAMILAAVVAGTGFLVLAQRRLRQLGMISAVGATRRQVRNVTLFHGLFVGVIAAAIGVVAAIAAWTATNSLIANAAGRRIGWGSVPLWLILAPGLMAVVAASAAAWWPARSMARIPVVQALSNRPADAMPGRRLAGAALLAAAVGVVCLRFAHQRNAVLMIVGLAAMIGAVLLSTPMAIRAATAHSARLPIAARLACRELGRNPSRSAAALATVTLAAGMSVAAVVITAANTHPATVGNLSDQQMLVRADGTHDPALVTPRTSAQVHTLDDAVTKLAGLSPGARVVRLDVAVDPAAPPTAAAIASGAEDVVQVVRTSGRSARSSPLYVATPSLLSLYQVAPRVLDAHSMLAADTTGTWSMLSAGREPLPTPARLRGPGYSSLPQTLVSPTMLATRRWRQVPAGWLIQASTPLTARQVASARSRAAAVGLTVETRDPQTYLGTLRLVFSLAGVAVTLAIIGIALVLLRTQTSRDQQILGAVGAARRTRRAIAASTATVLAGLGVVLGLLGAYATLVLAYSDTLARLDNVPVSALSAIALGVPALALTTTWLSAGRLSPSLARAAID